MRKTLLKLRLQSMVAACAIAVDCQDLSKIVERAYTAHPRGNLAWVGIDNERLMVRLASDVSQMHHQVIAELLFDRHIPALRHAKFEARTERCRYRSLCAEVEVGRWLPLLIGKRRKRTAVIR